MKTHTSDTIERIVKVNKNRIWIKNLTLMENIQIHIDELNNYLKNGFARGMMQHKNHKNHKNK